MGGVVHASGMKQIVTPAPKALNEAMNATGPGEHLWIAIVAYRVSRTAIESGAAIDLDVENLLTVSPPGCAICEQMFTPEVADSPCPGEP